MNDWTKYRHDGNFWAKMAARIERVPWNGRHMWRWKGTDLSFRYNGESFNPALVIYQKYNNLPADSPEPVNMSGDRMCVDVQYLTCDIENWSAPGSRNGTKIDVEEETEYDFSF